MFEMDGAGNVTMHRGDTGAFKVQASRRSGTAWTEHDRMLMTVRSAGGQVVMQRIYRLDDAWGLGDGIVQIELHNDDTDTWEYGMYTMERRYVVNPVWESGSEPAARCVDALATGDRMVEGHVVRTVFQGTLSVTPIYGEV